MARSKTIFDPKYKTFIDELVKIRKKKNLSQRALAELAGEAHPFIANIETCERRLDALEAVKIMKAMKLSRSEILKVFEKLI